MPLKKCVGDTVVFGVVCKEPRCDGRYKKLSSLRRHLHRTHNIALDLAELQVNALRREIFRTEGLKFPCEKMCLICKTRFTWLKTRQVHLAEVNDLPVTVLDGC